MPSGIKSGDISAAADFVFDKFNNIQLDAWFEIHFLLSPDTKLDDFRQPPSLWHPVYIFLPFFRSNYHTRQIEYM